MPIDSTPLDEIVDRECARERIAEAVDIVFGSDRTIDENDRILTTLEIARRAGTDPVTIESIRGSEIFALKPIEPLDPLAQMPTANTAALSHPR